MLKREIYTWFLLAIILSIGLFFRLIFLDKMNLFVDEAYYWDWSRNLSFGYFSHPPMVAWLIWLGRLLFGDTEIGVRIPFVVLGLGTILASYFLARTFFDQKTAFLFALLVSLSPSYVFASRIATPDQAVIFFWILAMIFFWRAYKDLRFRDWILLGIFLGLGFLSKYQIVFLPLAIFIFLIFRQKGRRLLRTSFPYISLAISLLIFLPNILWNATHSWITFIFQSVYGIERSFGQSFALRDILENFLIFSKELIAAPDIVLKLAVLLSLPLFFWCGVKQKREEFVFLFASFIFITSFFSIFFGKSHWFFPGAVGAYLIFAVFIVDLTRNRLGWVIMLIFTLYLLFLNVLNSWNLISTLALGKELRPPLSNIGVYRQVFGDSYGWRDTVKKLEDKIDYRPKEKILVAQFYTIASELAFYLSDRPRVYSPNGQYLIWGPPKNEPENTVVVAYNPEFLNLQADNVVKITQEFRTLSLATIHKVDWKKLESDWRLNLEGP